MPVITTKVYARNEIGRFISECEAAATRTVKDMLDAGADVARKEAPVGPKPDRRTVPLRDSIETHMTSRTSGYFSSNARHAGPIEFGAVPHVIPGNPYLHFFWESEGRWWVPGLLADQDLVNHPGNAAQPFMGPGFRAIVHSYGSIAARHYPG